MDTLCTVAEAEALWRVGRRHLPAHCQAIREAVAANTIKALELGYSDMASADFSREVTARQLGIAVTDVTDSGFSEVATLEQALRAFPGLSDRCYLPAPPAAA